MLDTISQTRRQLDGDDLAGEPEPAERSLAAALIPNKHKKHLGPPRRELSPAYDRFAGAYGPDFMDGKVKMGIFGSAKLSGERV
jgi:hypothetical protein